MSDNTWSGSAPTITAIAELFDKLWSARRVWYDTEDGSPEEDRARALVDELDDKVSALPAGSPAAVLVKLLLFAEIDETFGGIEWGATALDFSVAADLPRTSDGQLLGALLRDLEGQVAGTALADVLAKHRELARLEREQLLKDPEVAAARERIERGRARDAEPGESELAERREPTREEIQAPIELTLRIVKTEKPEGYGPDESRARGDHIKDAMDLAGSAIQARRRMTAGQFNDKDRAKVEETLAEFEHRFGPIEGPPPAQANDVRRPRRPRLQHPSSW